MRFQVTNHEVSVTLTRAELGAMLAIASKDIARFNLCGVLLDPAERVAVATDGHRLLVARAAGCAFVDDVPAEKGEHAADREARVEALRREHAAYDVDPHAAKGRHVIVGRDDAVAWHKACGSKESIRVRWNTATDGAGVELTTCIVDASGREGARFGGRPVCAQFPPWTAVIPSQPAGLAAWSAVNAAYLADAMAALAKVSGSIAPKVYIWPSAASGPKSKTKGSLDPMIIAMEHTGADDVGMHWRYILMPMKADEPIAPWKDGAPKVATVDGASGDEAAANDVRPIGKRTRKRAA